MKSVGKIRQELLLKEIRTAYWEIKHKVPSMSEIEKLEEVIV